MDKKCEECREFLDFSNIEFTHRDGELLHLSMVCDNCGFDYNSCIHMEDFISDNDVE